MRTGSSMWWEDVVAKRPKLRCRLFGHDYAQNAEATWTQRYDTGALLHLAKPVPNACHRCGLLESLSIRFYLPPANGVTLNHVVVVLGDRQGT